MYKAFARFAVLAIAAIGTAAACTVPDQRVCDVDARLKAATSGHTVQYKVGSARGYAEYEWALGQPDIIHLGDTQQLDDDQLYFVIAHEFGHSVLRHGRKLVESFAPASASTLSDADLFRQFGHAAQTLDAPVTLNHLQEFEADAFAAKILNTQGINYAKVMRNFLRSTGGSSMHPAKSARIEQAKKAVELALNI